MAKVIEIKRHKRTTEQFFNLAVAEDESFVANGMVVHNCKSWLRPVLKGNVPKDEKIRPLNPPASAVKGIQFSEAASCCGSCGRKSGD